MSSLTTLLAQVRACTACRTALPFEPKPILRAHRNSKILIIGQAPGTRVHKTGIPWNDPSGDRLREWMNIERDTFYDEKRIAIIPMGFCYPGKGKSGDLPPRKECAELWHAKLVDNLDKLELIMLVGQYAQAHYLGKQRKKTLAETVQAWREYDSLYFPLPHPSPRNKLWLKKNSWFEKEVVPELRKKINKLL